MKFTPERSSLVEHILVRCNMTPAGPIFNGIEIVQRTSAMTVETFGAELLCTKPVAVPVDLRCSESHVSPTEIDGTCLVRYSWVLA